MKIFVYVTVFCLLFFLLVLSFDEGRKPQQESEWDTVSETFETAISPSETPTSEMQNANEIAIAQQQNTTGLGLVKLSFSSMFNEWKANISDIFTSLADKTKESAYLVATDISELIYPTKKSGRAPKINSVTDSNQNTLNKISSLNTTHTNEITIQSTTPDKTIPIPNTMVNKNNEL